MRKIESGGGTNILAALDAAYRCADDDRPAAIVLVGDGVANAGPHHYRDFIRQVRGHDMRLFTFIMGNGANRPLLEDLPARVAAYGLGSVVILKAVAETVWDTRLFTSGIDLSGVPVGEAHLAGPLCGLAAGILGRAVAQRALENPAIAGNAAAAV